MKVTQCVFARLPEMCPKSGLTSVSFNISLVKIWHSFHLKIKIPCGSNTLKHSANPALISFCQVLFKIPYFLAIQLFAPSFIRCGGSKTTNLKLSSSNGKSVKSSAISGLISKLLPSHNVWVSVLISPNKTSLLALSNQNILLPQQTSNIFSLTCKASLRCCVLPNQSVKQDALPRASYLMR